MIYLWTIGSGGLFFKGRREKADVRYRSSEIPLAKVQQDIIQDIIVVHTQVHIRQEQITIAKQGVMDAEESLRLNENRLKHGMGLPLEVYYRPKTPLYKQEGIVSRQLSIITRRNTHFL